jgi:hypothetical protein
LGLGGEALGGGAAFLVAFFAFWKIGVVVWCLVGRHKAACLVVESCKSGRKERAQRQRGRLSRTVRSRTAEKGKVNRWEGQAVEQASIQ